MAQNIFSTEPIRPITPKTTQSAKAAKSAVSTDFNQVLAEKLNEIKFSSHAQQRLKSRNIEFGSVEMQKLQNAVSKAREKGARDSLIMMNDLALIVSVKNNTVITAVDGDSLRENVFTNIDSAVFV
ncbi:MAG: TIGR02530 family flagellar biosynthesis protein [Ignavibacteriales bacterium]